MKTDMQVMRQTHNQEVKRFQDDLGEMRSEMNSTKTELDETQQQNMEMLANIKSLNDELDRFRQIQEETAIEVSSSCICYIYNIYPLLW